MKKLFRLCSIIYIITCPLSSFATCNGFDSEVFSFGACIKELNEENANKIAHAALYEKFSNEEDARKIVNVLKAHLSKDQYFLYRYQTGQDGVEALEKSSQLGSAEAPYWIWFENRHKNKEYAIASLQVSAERGFQEAQKEYGIMLIENGEAERGLDFLEKAAFSGLDSARKAILFFKSKLSKEKYIFWKLVEDLIYKENDFKFDYSINSWSAFCDYYQNDMGIFKEKDILEFNSEKKKALNVILYKCLELKTKG